ncbi:hypothetical protein [Paracoccus yeei]|nr:hypothetical protein [Paracoccus yeei]
MGQAARDLYQRRATDFPRGLSTAPDWAYWSSKQGEGREATPTLSRAF